MARKFGILNGRKHKSNARDKRTFEMTYVLRFLDGVEKRVSYREVTPPEDDRWAVFPGKRFGYRGGVFVCDEVDGWDDQAVLVEVQEDFDTAA